MFLLLRQPKRSQNPQDSIDETRGSRKVHLGRLEQGAAGAARKAGVLLPQDAEHPVCTAAGSTNGLANICISTPLQAAVLCERRLMSGSEIEQMYVSARLLQAS